MKNKVAVEAQCKLGNNATVVLGTLRQVGIPYKNALGALAAHDDLVLIPEQL